MILLIPGNAAAISGSIKLHRDHYGWLLTSKRSMTRQGLYGLRFAIDNECFTQEFDPDKYRRLLKRIFEIHGSNDCLFATAPDVVGNAYETWDRSKDWLKEIRKIGLPCALVAQDGLESMHIQWSEFDAIFIGGTTAWKLSSAAAWISDQARQKMKWIHMGRVNSVYRASRIIDPPDSIDGTAWAKHPTKYVLQWSHWLKNGKPRQPHLFLGDHHEI